MKPRNLTPTRNLTMRTTERVLKELGQLAETGLFGKSRGEVAEQLVREKLRELIREGWTKSQTRRR